MEKLIFGKNKNIERSSYLWNTAAGLINASEAVILLMVVTRVTGLEDAGILTIAFAIGNLLMTVGRFGVRNFQVTDVKEEFGFGAYFYARIITVFLMLAASLGYGAFGHYYLHYSIKKVIVILCICVIYVVESLEDVFWGRYQQKGRLDVGGRIFSYRWIITMLVFSIGICITKDMIFASVFAAVVSIVLDYFLLRYTSRYFELDFAISDKHDICRMIKQCSSLFAVAFLTYYVTNAPKYAIDAKLSDEVQACYGFVFMPVFVIELLNNFLYQPVLVQMAQEWNEGELALFRKRILRQLVIIAALTACCLAGAYLLGIPVLSIIYSTDLTAYKAELMILMLGGGLLAVVGFLGVVITVMRKQRNMVYAYIAAAIIAFLFSARLVSLYGAIGASVLYTALMALLSVAFGCMVMAEYVGRKNG